MARGIFSDNILRCPFCDSPIGELEEVMTRFGNTFTGGKCACGAVYVFDGSGHNLGDAYVDALTYAYDGDMDKAWSMTPDEDYEVRELGYDSRRNRFMSSLKRSQATYLFVLVKKQDP
jgi:hypothetical protein